MMAHSSRAVGAQPTLRELVAAIVQKVDAMTLQDVEFDDDDIDDVDVVDDQSFEPAKIACSMTLPDADTHQTKDARELELLTTQLDEALRAYGTTNKQPARRRLLLAYPMVLVTGGQLGKKAHL